MAETENPAIETVVDAYYTDLYRFAYSLAKNEHQASDLTQDTFLIYVRKGDSLRDSSKLKSWLFTTLYREFLRLRRRGGRETSVEPEQFDSSPTATVDSTVADEIDGSAAVEALQKVDEAYRAPLTLFYLKDMAYKEIAETLDIPIGTVMSRLSRGKKQLREVLLAAREKNL